jgi:hypothetical protein
MVLANVVLPVTQGNERSEGRERSRKKMTQVASVESSRASGSMKLGESGARKRKMIRGERRLAAVLAAIYGGKPTSA